MEKIMRCAIYIRVSTAEQQIHGKSLQAQQEYLEKYANDHGMKVVGIYADEGKTARKELKKRKAIHSLLIDVKNDEVDLIIFWKMDRWFRNVSDFYKVQDILDLHHTKWIATAEPNINMETREGRLNLNIMLSIGQNEVDTTSERIKFTVDNMIKNGRLVFGEANMPLGFMIAEVDGVKRMVKDPNTAEMVNEFFHYFRTHQKKRHTVYHMQEAFGIDFSYAMLRTMLSSEFYIGKYRGCDYCPAYLTQEEWDDIQAISKRNIRTPKHSSRVYLFSSLIRCPTCGQKLCGTGCSSIINRKTGEKRSYSYYRCNRAITDGICENRHRLSQNLMENYLLENLEYEFTQYKLRHNQLNEAIQKGIKKKDPLKIKREMEKLNIMFQKDRIDLTYYNTEYEKLENDLNLISQVIPIKKRNLSYVEQVLAEDFRTMYVTLSLDHKQIFWHKIIQEIYINEDYHITHVDFL